MSPLREPKIKPWAVTWGPEKQGSHMGLPLRGICMAYNPGIHHRRSIRLREYDYSAAGAYFVTICVQDRLCMFGEIANGEMRLNGAGRMVGEWWLKLPDKFPHLALDEYVIMPNHFHGIVTIVGAPPCGWPPFPPCGHTSTEMMGRPHGAEKAGRPHGAAPTGPQHVTLGNVMDWFKTMTTNAYIRGVKQAGWPSFPGRLWQRNYYERVIRDDAELSAIREYIRFNPANWLNDDQYQP